jgi:hypothetical protein
LSSWSEIRSRTQDPLSSTINSLILRQNQSNAIQDEITDADTIFPVRILSSKMSMDDKNLTVGYTKPVSQAFYLPFEPDGNVVKLWTRFDSGGVNVTDYSHFRNNIEIRHDDEAGAPQPTLLMTAEDDGVAKNKISSYLEKDKKHYFRVTDPQFSLEDGNTHFSFFFKIYPTLINNEFENGKRAVLLDYIENDQVTHAVRVEIGDNGYLYFYVRWNSFNYFVQSDAPLFTFPDEPDYFSQDYAEEDFYASEEDRPFSLPLDFTYIFCTFNKDTKIATILNPVDEDTVNTWSSNTPITIPQQSNLSMWLPLSEGNGETLNDISGLNNHGSFSAVDSARKPSWTTMSGRPFLEFGDRDYFTIPKSTSLNTLTTGFTVSLFLYLHSDYYSIAHSKVMFRSAATGNGRLTIYTPTGTSRAIGMDVVTNAGTSRFLQSGGTPLPENPESWAHIVVTYDGSTYKFYCNKVQTPTAPSHSGDQFTNSNEMFVGTSTDNLGGHSNISNVMFWKNVALTQEQIEQLYDDIYPSLTSPMAGNVFPPGFDDPPEPDPPGTPITLPFTQTPYSQQTGENYSAVRPVTVSGLTQVYSVAGGAPVEDPQVVRYNVAPGVPVVTTTGPQTIYNLAGNGSDVIVPEENDFGGQRIKNTSSVLYNQKITEITLRIRTTANSLSGEVRIGVIKANGDFIQFGAAIAGTAITGSYQSFTRTNSGNTYQMAVGDAVGVYWFGADDSTEDVRLESAGSGVHTADGANSRFSYKVSPGGTGGWTEDTNRSVAMTVKNAGGTTTTNPYWSIITAVEQPYAVGETFPSGSPMLGITPTKIELRVYRHASAAGTVFLRHVDTNNNVKATLKTQAVSGLPTTAPTTFNFTWEDLTYDKPIAAGDNILVVLSGGNSNPVYVLGNEGATGSNSEYDGTRSRLIRRISGNPGTFGFGVVPESWSSNSARDISGIITSGGNDFTGYINLNNTRKRTGIKADTASSSLVGKKVTKVTATLKKVGTPAAGAIYCRIRNSAGAIRETLNQTDISSISTTDTSIDFIKTTHNITLNTDDTISIEYDLGDASNYVQVRVNKNQFEGVNTILFESLASSIDTATPVNDRDLAAVIYTGGETDVNARPRVGIICNNSDSSLWGRAITKIRLWLKREGSTFGAEDEISVKVVRGSDKATVATLGTKVILDLDPAVGTAYDFENTGNSYVMANGDMIVVENLFGNASNYVWVKRSATDVIDGTGSCLVDWNGSAYNIDTGKDINAIAWTGGFTVYPDPNIPTAPTPYHYSHELFFGASTTPDSNAETYPQDLEPDPQTMFNFIAADLRLYQGRVINDEEALNLFRNKYTIFALPFGQINTVAHSIVGPNPS